ncbi:hypothetical protein BDZ94DRAFT_1245159 [Collybia nuda]|uniref:DUF952 domain-containing protein n=1 Tax=Collybia nuda TaxID=64659 RepID=A0A9P6CQV2_9AGAR|nr:hypothetical protein BDZ94DRAFT_1245159 [Collybia nuda]
MSKPTYLYKIIPSSDPPPEPLPEKLPLSKLDSSSGFIHLSTAAQIPGTLKRFFMEEPLVYILKISYDPLEKDIRWEDPEAKVCGERGGEGMFPHLYNGGRLGRGEVESQAVWENNGVGWDQALERAESWLIY